MKKRFSAAALLVCAAMRASGAAGGVVLCPSGLPPAAVAEAWGEKGISARAGLDPAEGETVAGVWCASLDLAPDAAARVAGFAGRGAPLWLFAGSRGLPQLGAPEALLPWLPANVWTFKPGLDRGRGELVARRAGLPPLPLSRRFDLHLPGAPVESALAAYLPGEWLRDRTRFPRTTVRAESGTDAALPLWLDADVGPARVQLLAFDAEDPGFASSPGGADWLRAIALAPFGPKGPDDSPRPASAASRARRAAAAPFAVVVEEDESSLGELDPAPRPREGIDGITSRRYVYRTGTAPKLRIRIRNHFCNVAPLAVAADETWPENPSAPGLNDGAFTTASVRGTLPVHAVWTGRNGAASQRLSLRWDRPVAVAGVRLWGFGAHRFWERANPRAFAVEADGAPFLSETNAVFAPFPFAPERSVWEGAAEDGRPRSCRTLRLSVSGLAPDADLEPRRDWKSNCALAEWEVWGWAGEPDAAPARSIALRVVEEDLSTGRVSTNALASAAPVPFCSERIVETRLPARRAFGPVRWRFQAVSGARVLAETAFDALFVPAEGTKLAPNVPENAVHPGLLCTPAWRWADTFGRGMNAWTRGWGGAHDQVWAWENGLMETGSAALDDPARLFGGAMRASHYTLPWTRFPSGADAFRDVADRQLDRLASGDWSRQGKTALHLGGADRWNGVPTGSCFTWDNFVRFDQWLRASGRPGLRGRSRGRICEEIRTELGDLWQTWLLRSYADLHLAVRRDAAARGLEYTFESHGSFPLAGGELGADLAKTHRGVGTDLFWELRAQDLWLSLGWRAGVVAANPDLRSGAYDEWGWVNAEQNRWWFGSSSSPEPARRQWYATYFLGRVDHSGTFRPYHETGFSSQGGHGVRYAARDHAARCRVHDTVTQLRPEEAAGVGVVVSWRGQERRMGPKLGRAGFGLWPEDGEESVDAMCGAVFSALAKQGVPVAFLTSTHALKEWKGTNALVLVDAPNWEDWEWDAALAARGRGAALLAVGAPHPRLANPRIVAALGEGGAVAAAPRGKEPPVLWSNAAATRFDVVDARALKSALDDALGRPFAASRGIAAVPFVSNGRAFLAVCRQGDDAGPARVEFDPSFLFPGRRANASAAPRAVSLDDGAPLPCTRLPDGRIRFQVPLGASDAKLVMLLP